MFNERARIGASALARGLPGLAYYAEAVPHGLLLSYGQGLPRLTSIVDTVSSSKGTGRLRRILFLQTEAGEWEQAARASLRCAFPRLK